MKYRAALLFCLMLFSCRTEEEIDAAVQQRATQDFQQIDISRIDAYPLFPGCNELDDTAGCFYRKLEELISSKLKMCELDLQLAARDSIIAGITINAQGQIRYDGIVQGNAGKADRVLLDSILTSRLSHLPTIQSALKRDIPVTSSYRIPIVFSPWEDD
ncbi:MAG: hypothetical protein WBA16_01990 [Nonlabens sp.]